MTDDSFISESLVTLYILFNDNKRNTIKAFIDTDIIEYVFIDEITVHIICESFRISFISLLKLKLIKDFNKYLIKQLITHVIYSDLTV